MNIHSQIKSLSHQPHAANFPKPPIPSDKRPSVPNPGIGAHHNLAGIYSSSSNVKSSRDKEAAKRDKNNNLIFGNREYGDLGHGAAAGNNLAAGVGADTRNFSNSQAGEDGRDAYIYTHEFKLSFQNKNLADSQEANFLFQGEKFENLNLLLKKSIPLLINSIKPIAISTDPYGPVNVQSSMPASQTQPIFANSKATKFSGQNLKFKMDATKNWLIFYNHRSFVAYKNVETDSSQEDATGNTSRNFIGPDGDGTHVNSASQMGPTKALETSEIRLKNKGYRFVYYDKFIDETDHHHDCFMSAGSKRHIGKLNGVNSNLMSGRYQECLPDEDVFCNSGHHLKICPVYDFKNLPSLR